ncbi:MAG: hypothetical protein JJV93_00280 [Alphaproteobacteria bacterium]|nr:hypothetical protein [Alphaproteobacteria bacterium]MBL0717692.1 hypothetical protein [Alphaproteobacteria bacterium]
MKLFNSIASISIVGIMILSSNVYGVSCANKPEKPSHCNSAQASCLCNASTCEWVFTDC